MPESALDVLVFAIERVRYGIAVADVVEVVRAVAVTPLAGAPAVIEGIIDHRGHIVPVFDTRLRFGHAPRAERLEDRFVIVRAGERHAALRADEADALARMDRASIEDPAAQVPGVEQIAGVARLADGLLLIHDPERFLSAAERDTLERALASADPTAPGAADLEQA